MFTKNLLKKVIAFKEIDRPRTYYSKGKIDWTKINDIRRSSDGTTGIYFLYFEGSKSPKLCLKFSAEPYRELLGTKIFEFLGLNTPKTKISDLNGSECVDLMQALDRKSLELEGANPHQSDRLYSAVKRLKAFGKDNNSHVVIMECIRGKSLEEVIRNDWAYNKTSQDEFYFQLGQGFLADAFIANPDRFEFLFCDNPTNYRIPFHGPNVLTFIDQPTQSLMIKQPNLVPESQAQKFLHLVNLLTEENTPPGTFLPIRRTSQRDLYSDYTSKHEEPACFDSEKYARGIVDTLVNLSINKSTHSNITKGFDFNFTDYTETLEQIITKVVKMVTSYTRYTPKKEQADMIVLGMKKMLEKINKTRFEDYVTLSNSMEQVDPSIGMSLRHLEQSLNYCKTRLSPRPMTPPRRSLRPLSPFMSPVETFKSFLEIGSKDDIKDAIKLLPSLHLKPDDQDELGILLARLTEFQSPSKDDPSGLDQRETLRRRALSLVCSGSNPLEV
ncbi:hypothetical protein DID80_01850 [Candidatus Marinamargulisbacteria bacterium SCGC AAA071-K20]|nr:hypothetical protein DID80_01850 [Candidatus Marinamargulisbacteria bacterium SCGC AAA071-K20]